MAWQPYCKTAQKDGAAAGKGLRMGTGPSRKSQANWATLPKALRQEHRLAQSRAKAGNARTLLHSCGCLKPEVDLKQPTVLSSQGCSPAAQLQQQASQWRWYWALGGSRRQLGLEGVFRTAPSVRCKPQPERESSRGKVPKGTAGHSSPPSQTPSMHPDQGTGVADAAMICRDAHRQLSHR